METSLPKNLSEAANPREAIDSRPNSERAKTPGALSMRVRSLLANWVCVSSMHFMLAALRQPDHNASPYSRMGRASVFHRWTAVLSFRGRDPEEAHRI